MRPQCVLEPVTHSSVCEAEDMPSPSAHARGTSTHVPPPPLKPQHARHTDQVCEDGYAANFASYLYVGRCVCVCVCGQCVVATVLWTCLNCVAALAKIYRPSTIYQQPGCMPASFRLGGWAAGNLVRHVLTSRQTYDDAVRDLRSA